MNDLHYNSVAKKTIKFVDGTSFAVEMRSVCIIVILFKALVKDFKI